jgi:hypothetical protein
MNDEGRNSKEETKPVPVLEYRSSAPLARRSVSVRFVAGFAAVIFGLMAAALIYLGRQNGDGEGFLPAPTKSVHKS